MSGGNCPGGICPGGICPDTQKFVKVPTLAPFLRKPWEKPDGTSSDLTNSPRSRGASPFFILMWLGWLTFFVLKYFDNNVVYSLGIDLGKRTLLTKKVGEKDSSV